MAKKKVAKPKRIVTRRQLSRLKKQKRRQRLIRILGISVILAVIGLVSFGVYYQWYLPDYKPLKETVIEVNDTKFNMDYYIKSIEFQTGGMSPEWVPYFTDMVEESIKQNELIRQEALGLGFTVSDEEVKETLDSYGYDDTQAARDAIRASLILTKLEEEYFELEIPLSAEQRYIMAMFLESEEQAIDVSARIEAGEDEKFGEIAGELSLESTTKENSGDLGWRPKKVLDNLLGTSALDSYVFNCQVGVLSQPIYDEEMTKSLGYWLIKVLEKDEETGEANAQAMLLSSEEEAQVVIARLGAGEDFGELAEEFSQYGAEGSKAEVGWIAEGGMTQAFEDYVFGTDTKMNVVSSPIRDEMPTTKGGYWLFTVLDEDTREISEEDRNLLVDKAIEDWVASLWDDPENTIVSYLDDEMKNFAISRVLGD